MAFKYTRNAVGRAEKPWHFNLKKISGIPLAVSSASRKQRCKVFFYQLVKRAVRKRPSIKFASMKKLAFLPLLFLAVLFTQKLHAQHQPNLGCKDTTILKQAYDIRNHYTEQGFVVMRDAMLGMESRVPYPVLMQLNKGDLYILVFIGSPLSKRIDLDLYDGNNQTIARMNVQRNRDQPNYIIHNFSPTYSGEYLVVTLQKLKEKSMCGSFFVLKLDPDKAKKGASFIPYE